MRVGLAHDHGDDGLDGGDVDMYRYSLYIMNFASSVDAALLPRSRQLSLCLSCEYVILLPLCLRSLKVSVSRFLVYLWLLMIRDYQELMLSTAINPSMN